MTSAVNTTENMASSSATRISVIVPSYNRAHYLEGALDSLTSQVTDGRFEYEVVVVDNGSTDDTRETVLAIAASASVTVRYLHESRPGDAPPRNKGIRESDSEWLAFFDDDQFAEPRWLLHLLQVAQDQQTSVVGGPVHLDLEQESIEQLSLPCRNTLREMKPYAEDQPYETDVIPGAGNLFVARELFDQTGLFREEIHEGRSDWELVEEARVRGVTPWYASQAVIRHRVDQQRLTPDYFCWDARNGGVSQADADFRRRGAVGLLLICAARMARAALFLPHQFLTAVRPPRLGSSRSSMIWWRTEGYARRCLTLLAPGLFPQKRFYEYVDFRTGRVVGT